MKVRFWGTRGSIAKPGPGTVRYGGNTSCVQVTSSGGTMLIIDCGTGAHDLGQHILKQKMSGNVGSILISHTHWDHIQGIPFFAPLFVPGNKWTFYAPRGFGDTLRDTLAGQMEFTYFPVTLDAFGAQVDYRDLTSAPTAAHIHCCTPEPLRGTATPVTPLPTLPGFNETYSEFARVGVYNRTFDLNDPATYNPTFISRNGGSVTAARDVFLRGLANDQAYFNIHTPAFPAGEIRGFLVPVPEPEAWLMLTLGLAGVGWCARRRARRS